MAIMTEDEKQVFLLRNDECGKCGACELMKRDAADTIERLMAENERLQANIDKLMLEYCPEDMTPEQLAEWARYCERSNDDDN